MADTLAEKEEEEEEGDSGGVDNGDREFKVGDAEGLTADLCVPDCLNEVDELLILLLISVCFLLLME